MNIEHTNALTHETSPYLLQHAHNPVDWLPWNEESLAKAKKENKPLLISIGYSACHWCHVMEHESFEDEKVAEIMNDHFVCIKVDREERPDVDQVYMDAVQLMTGSGGWPLNCFALPDGRPFYGGTYFRKDQWIQILNQLADLYKNDPEKIEEYANKLTEGLKQMDDQPLVNVPEEFDTEVLATTIARWKKSFDLDDGGPNRAPKFPMPNNYQFLLAYAHQNKDDELLDYVHLTLQKLSYGGIYDQIGGGFARYSTDEVWKLPHFEKMLYDNGQLLSLYAQAFQQSGNELYKQTMLETMQWLKREMLDGSGAFYSALDADSEGEEGKFYVWTKDEIKHLAKEDFDLIADYYNVNHRGNWEHGNYILLRHDSDETIAQKHHIDVETLHIKVAAFNKDALAERAKRARPGLDDKTLTSWNALASKGLVDVYISTGNKEALEMAKANLDFLTSNQMTSEGKLWHSYKNGQSTINGYLEDYAHLIDALIRYYEATLDDDALQKATSLIDYVLKHFEQSENGMFYFKSMEDEALVAKKAEITDNVIPASNSILATCFFKIGLLYGAQSKLDLSKSMMTQVIGNFNNYPSGYSQWMLLYLMHSQPYYEVAVVGNKALEKLQSFQNHFLPNVLLCGSKNEESIPVLEHKLVDGKTLLYVCQFGACKSPTESWEVALDQLR